MIAISANNCKHGYPHQAYSSADAQPRGREGRWAMWARLEEAVVNVGTDNYVSLEVRGQLSHMLLGHQAAAPTHCQQPRSFFFFQEQEVETD